MAKLPDAKIRLKAKDETKKGVNSAKKGFNGLSTAIKGTAIASGLLAAGLAVIISRSLTATDNIGKMSKIYGIATQDLAAFNLAAQIGGTTLEQFAKAARNVAKNVFEFVTKGTGEAVDAFRALGITTEELLPIWNDQVAIFNLMADRLKEIPDGLAKTAIAYDLFGGRAIALLPAIADGSEGFKKFREEVELFGTALSDASVKGVEQLNDDMLRLKFVMKGFTDQTVAALAPAMNIVVNSLRQWALGAAETKGGVEALAKTIAVNVMGQLENLVLGAAELINKFRQAIADTRNLRTSLNNLTSVFDGQRRTIELLGNAILFWSKAVVNATSDSDKLVTAKLIDIDKIKERFEKLKESIIEVQPEAQKLAEVSAETFINLIAGGGGIEAVTTFHAQHSKGLENNIILWKELSSEVTDYTEELEELEVEIESTDSVMQELGFTFTSAFEDAVIAGASFRDVLQGIFEDIQRIILRKTLTEPFAKLFDSFDLGSLLGGGSGFDNDVASGIGGLVTGGGGPALGAGLSDFAFAEGTDFVPQTGFALLHKGEAVIPASQNRGGGNVTLNQTINIDARNSNVSALELEDAARRGGQEGYQLVLEDLAKNGPIKKQTR